MGVVGYSNKAQAEHYNWSCNMFQKIGGGNLSLADIKVDDTAFIWSTVEFFDKDGAVNMVDDPDMGLVYEQYLYIPAEFTACGEDGWYFVDDGAGNYNRKDRAFKFGEAYVVNCNEGEEDALFGDAGQVSKETQPFNIEEHYNWLGNCNPVEKKLEDITVDDMAFIWSTVEFFDKDGAVKMVDDPDMGLVYEQYLYIPAEYTACGEDGWFFVDDGAGNYNRKDRVIGAGEGFIVNCNEGEEGAAIALPAAL